MEVSSDRRAIGALFGVLAVSAMLLIRVHGSTIFFIAEGDDRLYAAQARAYAIDHDFSFSNPAYESFLCLNRPDKVARYAIGSPLLWAPFVWLGSFFSESDQMVVLLSCVASVFYGLLGFGLLFLLLRRWFSVTASLASTLLVGLSSPVLYYIFRRPLMAHSSEFFALCAVVYGITGLARDTPWWKITLAGIACGFVFLTRWNNAPFFIAFGAWAVMRCGWRRTVVFSTAAGVTAALQLLFWKITVHTFYPGTEVFGEPPIPSVLFAVYPWSFRHLADLFVGIDWGIFLLSPITFISAVVMAWLIFKRRVDPAFWFLMLPCLPVFWIAANWPSHGGEYGNRYVLSGWVLFSWLFAWLAQKFELRTRAHAALLTVGGLSCIYSLVALSLFKSNADSLTLFVGPVPYADRNDWVNNEFTRNAAREMVFAPKRTAQSFGASLAPLLIFKTFDRLGSLPLALQAPFHDYEQRHRWPSRTVLLALMLGGLAAWLAAWFITMRLRNAAT